MSKSSNLQRIDTLTSWMKSIIKRRSVENKMYTDPLFRKGLRDRPKEVFTASTYTPVEEKRDNSR